MEWGLVCRRIRSIVSVRGRQPSLDYARSRRRYVLWPWLISVAVIMLSLMLPEWIRPLIRRVRHSGAACMVTIHASDSVTGQRVSFGTVTETAGRTDWSLNTQDGLSGQGVRIRWKDVDDLKVTVSSYGYEPAEITLNSGSPTVLNVKLRRSN